MTGIELISSSLRLIGALASGETPPGAEGADSLVILNQMLDSWNSERLSVFTIARQEFSLTTSQQEYTMGSGGDFDVVRPARIERASIIQTANPSQPLELPLEILDTQGWQRVNVKNITSSLPRIVYINYTFPLITLSYWPIPDTARDTALYTWTALTAFTLAADNLFPPGYLKAIRYNLAVDLAPEFGRTTPVEVAVQARESKGIIKAHNTPAPTMTLDVPGGEDRGYYDFYSDQPVGWRY
jgi:hypothetical protein